MVDESGDQLVADLPESAVAWLDEQAAAHEVTREEFLNQLVAAARKVDGDSPAPATDEALETLTERIETVEDDLEAKIEDIRERVVQIKRETDSKAPSDHEHPELTEEIRVAAETADAAQSTLEDLENELREHRETTERGFDNYEEVLEYLTETTDDFEEKLTRMAAVLVATRRAVDDLGAGEAERRAVEELKTAANRHGIETADCEHCGEDVDIGLLADPACPHCGTSLRDVEPAAWFFGSPTLLEGEPSTPVAESPTEVGDHAGAEEAVEALIEGGTGPEVGDGTETDATQGDETERDDPDGDGVETDESVSDGDPDE